MLSMQPAITHQSVTLEEARSGVRAYNHGKYRGLKNPDIDRQALNMFAGGLGRTEEKIFQQVDFIGRDYGGTAFRAAYGLAPAIAHDIFADRAQYEQVASSAVPIENQAANQGTILILYRPFVKTVHGKSNWQVWGRSFGIF